MAKKLKTGIFRYVVIAAKLVRVFLLYPNSGEKEQGNMRGGCWVRGGEEREGLGASFDHARTFF